jgi:putative ABC transport system ATP-binding protein
MSTPVVALESVSRVYQMGTVEVRALDRVDLRIEDGEYMAIMGRSGSGKSTLLNVLGCLDRPTEGDYFLEGSNVADLDDDALSSIRNRQLGFVFQAYNLIPHLTVLENVEVPLEYAGVSPREARERATVLVERMGLGDRLRHRPTELSGGQQQRVAIARALANEPSLLLADEPTGNLDTKTGREILDLLRRLNEGGTTLVVVTHDSNIAQRAHRTVHMRDGRIERIEVRA